MARVRALCGTVRSARIERIDAEIADHPNRSILITSTRMAAANRMERLARRGDSRGVWGRTVVSFEDFVSRLLHSCGIPAEPISDVERRLLLISIVNKQYAANRLSAIGAAALSRGFVSHLMHVITELKQAAVEPQSFRKKLAARIRETLLDDVVADIYAEYQAALLAQGAYDRVGLFWQADIECLKKKPSLLDSIYLIAFDGFDDFTPSEFRVVRSLGVHVEQLVFGINASVNTPSRQDLFSLPLRTLREIQGSFNDVETLDLEEPTARMYSEFAASELLWRDEPTPPRSLTPNIALVPCHDAMHEVESAARRIKTLILDKGVQPDAIAIVCRSLSSVAGLIRAAFSEFGIPLSMHYSPFLDETVIGAFLLQFLDATVAWRREEIVDLVCSPLCQQLMPDSSALSPAFRAIVRNAGVIQGVREWLSKLETYQRKLRGNASTDNDENPEFAEAAANLEAQIRRLRNLSKPLHERDTPANYAALLLSLIDELRVDGLLANEHEVQALDVARDLMWRLKRSSIYGNNVILRSQFRGDLKYFFHTASVTTTLKKGGVSCIDASGSRHLDFDHVFAIGLNEGEWPAPAGINAIYSESDIEDFRRIGIHLESNRVRAEREALLFHYVVASTHGELTISWRQASKQDKPCLPSPFIEDLRSIFPDRLAACIVKPRSDFVPLLTEVSSQRDLRNAVFAAGGNAAKPFMDMFSHTRMGAAIETVRQGMKFGCYDGVLDANSAETVAALFDETHRFSATELESYSKCPFEFFMTRILRIRETKQPLERLDAPTIGDILHKTLYSLHDHFRGRALSELPVEEVEKEMLASLDIVFSQASERWGLIGGFATMERQRLECILRRYLLVERDRGAAWKPTHFELAFGESDTDASGQAAAAYVFDADGLPILLRGRIDRIDRNGDAMRIIDYKTSPRIEQAYIKDGASLQLLLYPLVLEEHLYPDATCSEARFVHIGSRKSVEAMNRDKGEWEHRSRQARQRVRNCVENMRAGYFPPTPYKGACFSCRAHRPCRYDTGRIERKSETTHVND